MVKRFHLHRRLYRMARGMAIAMLLSSATAAVWAKAQPTWAGKSRPAAVMAQSVSAAKAKPVLSLDARAALSQVINTHDNGGAPFVVIDKQRARLWLFDNQGNPLGNTAVLLGYARGDDTVPGVGDKPLAQVKDSERTTPAGRFVAEPGSNGHGEQVIWVDYDAAVSMHRVHDVHGWEHREWRLRTATVADNRISYGCINVPAAFFEKVLLPSIGNKRSIVYVLPETRSVATLFRSDTATRHAELGRFD
jgi:hypothetical protein